MGCCGLQLLMDASGHLKHQSKGYLWARMEKKHGKLPLFLPSHVLQPRLHPFKSILEAQAAIFMGWRWNTQRGLDGSKHKSPDSSELQVPLSPVQGINEEEDVENIRLGSMLKALRHHYPLGCPTPAIKSHFQKLKMVLSGSTKWDKIPAHS